jgi:hypothetical protein
MTDRELLALAAKAAGIPVVWDDEAGCYLRQDRMGTVPWVPLTDDGDALRLLVKLRLGLVPLEEGGFDCIRWIDGAEHVLTSDLDYHFAIVRAAAQLGKAMP